MTTIILVHGILGIGADLFPGLKLPFAPLVDYFNGVAAHMRASGITPIAPTVPPLQSIEDRGDELARQLQGQLPPGRIDIIAHSMGGLDARFLLHRYPDIAGRITTLTTIGTPHHGSAVADMVHSATAGATDLAPPFLLKQIGALTDLTTKQAELFNARTPDHQNVRYMNIAGVATDSEQQVLLRLAARIGLLSGPNDGVVLRSSALYGPHQHLPDWPVDHFGEIGWANWGGGLSLGASSFYPDGHLERYDALLKTIGVK
jgi:triacylglycerol lipase